MGKQGPKVSQSLNINNMRELHRIFHRKIFLRFKIETFQERVVFIVHFAADSAFSVVAGVPDHRHEKPHHRAMCDNLSGRNAEGR